MSVQRVVATSLAALLAMGFSPTLALEEGTLAGKATDEARRPYMDYAVYVRNVETGYVVQYDRLDVHGMFSFADLEIDQRYLVELFDTRESRVVCTEGPYYLRVPDLPSKTDVNIDCGRKALWLLLSAPAVGVVVPRSGSR
jgi:hypothetical protein